MLGDVGSCDQANFRESMVAKGTRNCEHPTKSIIQDDAARRLYSLVLLRVITLIIDAQPLSVATL